MNETEKMYKLCKMAMIITSIIILVICGMKFLNDKTIGAIVLFVVYCLFVAIMYVGLNNKKQKQPGFFENKLFVFIYFIMPFICMLIVFFVVMKPFGDKRIYNVGDIKITFPKGDSMVYGTKDGKGYSDANYYEDKCYIKLKVINNDPNKEVLENIKNSVSLDGKITDDVSERDLYNLDLTEGKETINGKEWVSYKGEYKEIKFAVYYYEKDKDLYYLEVHNYNEKPSLCDEKIKETFNKIEYK